MSLPPGHLGIVGNREKEEARALVPGLARWLRRHGYPFSLERGLARAVPGAGRGSPLRELVRRSDALLVLGGDGTLLSAAREASRAGVPLLGVNLGGLGFLTETALPDLYPALRRLYAGEVAVHRRMMVEARIERREGGRGWTAAGLNDAVLHAADRARVIRFDLRIGRTPIGAFVADGLIVATPTGSTAYSLSAGGPVVRPTVEALLATPVCPHALAFRPLLVGAGEVLRIRLRGGGPRARVTVDGQVSRLLEPGDQVTVRRAKTSVDLLTLDPESFYEVLRGKLAWAQGPRGARARS